MLSSNAFLEKEDRKNLSFLKVAFYRFIQFFNHTLKFCVEKKMNTSKHLSFKFIFSKHNRRIFFFGFLKATAIFKSPIIQTLETKLQLKQNSGKQISKFS